MTTPTELEAAVELVTERLFEAADRNPSLSLLSCGADLRTILSALADSESRRVELEVAAQDIAPPLTLFPADIDAGDDEEMEIYTTRGAVKRVRIALGLDPYSDPLNPKQEGSRDHG